MDNAHDQYTAELEERIREQQRIIEALQQEVDTFTSPRVTVMMDKIRRASSPSMIPAIAIGGLVEAIEDLGGTDLMKMIEAFHEKFELEYHGRPRNLPKALSDFRIRFLREELKEYEKAVKEKDLEGQFDALIDLVYVALGTAYMHGFNFNEGFKRVQLANMRKKRVESQGESKRGSKFDVVKPAGWNKPYLKDLL